MNLNPVSYSPHIEKCVPTVHKNKDQLHQAEDVKYLGLHIDRRLTLHKHIFTKRKQLGITLIKMQWLLGRKLKLSTNNKNPHP
jgi:hypothetical protein